MTHSVPPAAETVIHPLRCLPDGVIFCSHATRRALILAYEALRLSPVVPPGVEGLDRETLTVEQVLGAITTVEGDVVKKPEEPSDG